MQYIRIELPHCAMQGYIPDMSIETVPPRRAIVICPGGGYAYRSLREAEPIALAFAAMGFCCFVAEYRVAPAIHPAPVLDVACAVAWVRAHAAEYHVNPDAIAVMGFYAGGPAAGSLGGSWPAAALMAQANLTPAEARPNAMVLCYPVITGGEFAHRGSFVNLTGSEDPALHAEYSLDTKVTAQTPPTFLWHTWTDGAVPMENTLLMASALRRAGVTCEVHIFPRGGHGLALCNPLTSTGPDQNLPECAKWVEMAAQFLETVLP